MPTVQSKLSTQLTDVLGPPWHKWALITAGVVGTVFIGRYVAQKYYVESISKVLKDENDRHELIRKEKTGMEPPDTRSGTDGGPETGAEIGSKPSRSEPATPLNQPSGLAMLSDINRPALRGSSMCDMVSGSYTRVPPRRRAVPSLASTQINMSLQTPEELILFGNEYVKRALKIWMDTRDRIQESDGEHVQQLQLIIQSTKQLIDEIDLYTKQAKKEKDKMRESKSSTHDDLLEKQETNTESDMLDIPDDTTIYESPDSSMESYCTLTYYDIEPNLHFFKLYTKALEETAADVIQPRVDRTEQVGCESKAEFVAKVHCLRQAFEQMFKSKKNCDAFTKMGEEILKALLENSTKDVTQCLAVYHRFIEYVCNKSNHELLSEEIKFRSIPFLNFYDLVIDYIIMDSFEDLDNPPQAIVAVVNNSWFGNSFKHGALQRAVEAVLKYKRSRLKMENGFFTNFYDILEFISPILAWGFLGSDNDLKLKCNLIKQAIQEVIRDYFDFNRVRYTNLTDLVEDVLIVTDIRFDDLQSKLSIFD